MLVLVVVPWGTAHAQEEEHESFVMHHVKDDYEWSFAKIGATHIRLPLPILTYEPRSGFKAFSSSRLRSSSGQIAAYRGYTLTPKGELVSVDNSFSFYNFSITKNVISLWISAAVLLAGVLWGSSRYDDKGWRVPRRGRALLEMLVCFVRDKIALPNIGHKQYKRFTPYLLTVFFFIWLNNLLGLLPGAANVTGNISVALVLALFTFFITVFNGNKHYWGHVFSTPGVPRWLSPIMIPIELVGLLTKPFALMVRLFANITAGHIILLSIVGLIFTLQTVWASAVSVPFGAFMLLLKLLVAFLQAYIFTLLSAIYIGAAVEEHTS